MEFELFGSVFSFKTFEKGKLKLSLVKEASSVIHEPRRTYFSSHFSQGRPIYMYMYIHKKACIGLTNLHTVDSLPH